MAKKKTIASAIAAIALSAAISGPALAAAPTFSGTLTCVHGGEVTDMDLLSGATKKEINDLSRYRVDTGYCDKGTVDSSGLTKDA